MQQNDISITITQAQEDDIHAKAAELRELIMAWAISLNDDQRAKYFKLGAARLEFDTKCDNYMHQRADLVPPNSSLPEYDKDGAALTRVKRMKASVGPLETLLEDTAIVLGSDRMDLNLRFYHYTEFGGLIGLAGSDAIHDDLHQSFPGRGPAGPPATPPPPGP
ncbi:MAG: hypothetical protein HY301_07340 [Verrucomicrobia bacterium]|nr:hypothetical protein [Verrucomicrobiota bacterium]